MRTNNNKKTKNKENIFLPTRDTEKNIKIDFINPRVHKLSDHYFDNNPLKDTFLTMLGLIYSNKDFIGVLVETKEGIRKELYGYQLLFWMAYYSPIAQKRK